MATHSDVRSVPDRVLKAYLWPLGGWGVGLLFLFAFGKTLWAITLCYPLAVWFGLLTLWWGVRTQSRLRAGELTRPEVGAGVRSIARILAGAALTPAIVFLALDPLSPGAWGTCASVGIVAGLAWLGANALPRVSHRLSYTAALFLAWLALPLNATGSLSIAFWTGLFEEVRSVVPT
jgi:hypothetical protein